MTVPLWVHVGVVMVLLGSCAAQHVFYNRRIRDLRNALTAKRVLMGEREPDQFSGSLTYGDISPAVAAYTVVRALTHKMPDMKLPKS